MKTFYVDLGSSILTDKGWSRFIGVTRAVNANQAMKRFKEYNGARIVRTLPCIYHIMER